jgi:hypothetical protein
MSSVISVLMGDANMVTEEVIKPHRVAGEGQKQPGRFVDTSFFQPEAELALWQGLVAAIPQFLHQY